MPQQLDLFGNVDQSFYVSRHWGIVDFIPTKGHEYKETCYKCLLQSSWDCPDMCGDCANAPCHAEDRADGRNGYYSIHQMPRER